MWLYMCKRAAYVMLAGVKVLSARFTIFDFLSFYTYRIFCRHLQQRTKVMKRRRGMLRVGLCAAPVGWFIVALYDDSREHAKRGSTGK